jgi:hypothetical protein
VTKQKKPSLPAKRSRRVKELIRAARSIVATIPYGIGGILEIQLFERMKEREFELAMDFLTSLANDVARIERVTRGMIRREFLATDEFLFVLRDVLHKASREHRAQKRDAFRAILLNCMRRDPRVEFDKKAFFLQIVDALAQEHILLLRHLYERRVIEKIDIPQATAEIWAAFGASSQETREYLYAGLDTLANRQLVTQESIPLQFRGSADMEQIEYREIRKDIQQFAITDLGIAFIEFITQPTNAGSRAEF